MRGLLTPGMDESVMKHLIMCRGMMMAPLCRGRECYVHAPWCGLGPGARRSHLSERNSAMPVSVAAHGACSFERDDPIHILRVYSSV